MSDLVPWYLAICLDCEPQWAQPFRSQVECDTWADEHAEATRHVVLRRMEVRGG